MIYKSYFFSTAFFCAISLLGVTSCSKPKVVTEKKADKVTVLSDKGEGWEFGSQSYQHAEKIVAFGTRPAQSKELEQTRQYIQSALSERGWVVNRQPFIANTPVGKMQFVNLYARFVGEGESVDQVWKRRHRAVVGAHIDTKKMQGFNYLGAVDAAGSVGMLIEMADYLGKHAPEIAGELELVFFDGEEAILDNMTYSVADNRDGLYGSHYYALNRNRKRKFGVVLDLLGHKNQIVKIPVDTPKKLVETYQNVVNHHGLQDTFGVSPISILDDHVPLNMFGTPSIDIIGEFSREDEWWHKPGDTMEALSAEQLGLSLKVALDLIGTQLKD